MLHIHLFMGEKALYTEPCVIINHIDLISLHVDGDIMAKKPIIEIALSKPNIDDINYWEEAIEGDSGKLEFQIVTTNTKFKCRALSKKDRHSWIKNLKKVILSECKKDSHNK